MCHVWMHVMALKHLWWLRWSDMKRSAWSSKGSSDDNSRASFIGKSKNIEAVSFVWTFDENASRLKVMPSFHFYICPSSAFFLMFTLCFVFMWMLNCTRGNKGHEKWSLFCLKHQKLWIRQLYISYLASYLCSEQKKKRQYLDIMHLLVLLGPNRLIKTLFLTRLSSWTELLLYCVEKEKKLHIFY